MNTKWAVPVAIIVATAFGLFGTPEKAAAAASGITSNNPVVTKVMVGGVVMYSIVQTGTVTLGPNDTFVGITVVFYDPNNAPQTPAVACPIPTAGGPAVNWTATFNYTTTLGNWTATASESVTKPGNMMTKVNALPLQFTVP